MQVFLWVSSKNAVSKMRKILKDGKTYKINNLEHLVPSNFCHSVIIQLSSSLTDGHTPSEHRKEGLQRN
jgi:hypothetical protein